METIMQRAREKLPRPHATHHHRQRAAVHRQGFQGVHPHRRHDPGQNLTLLPAIQRQDRTLPQDDQGRVHPRQGAAVAGRRAPHRRRLRRALQHTSACTAPSATSLPRTNSKAATRKSSPSATASWPRPANAANSMRQASSTAEDRFSPRHGRPSTSPPCARRSRWPPSCTCSASSHVPAAAASNAVRVRYTAPPPAPARCFSVNLKDQIFHCFKCGRSGNALDLWAKANRLTPYDAALDLCQRLEHPAAHSAAAVARNREEEPVALRWPSVQSPEPSRIVILLLANSIVAILPDQAEPTQLGVTIAVSFGVNTRAVL